MRRSYKSFGTEYDRIVIADFDAVDDDDVEEDDVEEDDDYYYYCFCPCCAS